MHVHIPEWKKFDRFELSARDGGTCFVVRDLRGTAMGMHLNNGRYTKAAIRSKLPAKSIPPSSDGREGLRVTASVQFSYSILPIR